MKTDVPKLRQSLIEVARSVISNDDPSHDINHAMRVLFNSEHIAQKEGGDLEVIIPAALFHDAVSYQKDDPRSYNAAEESAELAAGILHRVETYPQETISSVKQAILEHSFGKDIMPESLESKIVQDADRLEATGALAIMRTFCSSGQMQRVFFDPEDPFCTEREPDAHTYALDLFYARLLKVGSMMNTVYARELAEKRTGFLYAFLAQVQEEIRRK